MAAVTRAAYAVEEIPLGARIFSVVDSFDATTSDCPDQRGKADETAREEIAMGLRGAI